MQLSLKPMQKNLVYLAVWLLLTIAELAFCVWLGCEDYLNYDSAYQYFLNCKDLPEMLRLIAEDYSPPLYTLMLKGVCCIFGQSLTVMRCAAIIPLGGMIFLALFPIREAFGERSSWLCTVFFSLTSVNTLLFHEIRPTILAYFLVTAAAVYFYLAYFGGKRSAYICATIFSVLAMYTHNVGMLSALALYLTALIFSAVSKDFKKLRAFFISGLISAVCYIPWLFVVIQQFGSVQSHYWKSSGLDVGSIINWSLLSSFEDFDDNLARGLIPLLLLAAIISFVIKNVDFSAVKNAKKLSDLKLLTKSACIKAGFVVSEAAAPIIVFCVFCLTVYPLVARRYFYIYAGIALLCLALICAKKVQLWVTIAAAVLMATSFCFMSVNRSRQLEEATFNEMIETLEDDGNLAFVHSHEWTLGLMMYYFPNARHYVTDETWCVLNSYDVFPTQVIHLDSYADISLYEDNFYVFNSEYPDTDIRLGDYYCELGSYDAVSLGRFTEPYSYSGQWLPEKISAKEETA